MPGNLIEFQYLAKWK